jgi:hypothetical protein
MDLSKLPKLSNTQESPAAPGEPAPQTPVAPTPVVEYRPNVPQQGIAGDVWFNAVIGLVLIGLGFTFARFLAAKIAGQPFHTGVNWTSGPHEGSEVAYFDLEGFTAWTDAGVFLFGLVVLMEAASKAAITIKPGRFSRGLLALAFVLTIGATLLNLFVCFKMLGAGIMPLLSGLAVAFGGWILVDEWRVLRTA